MHLRDEMAWLGRGALDLVAPPHELCAFCGQPAGGRAAGLCRSCETRITWVTPPYCTLCGRPLRLNAAGSHICSECLSDSPFFSRARAVGIHEGLLRQAIHGLKYGGQIRLAVPLAAWMASTVKDNPALRGCSVAVPVPSHPGRLAERGYNHAALLSERLAAGLRIRHEPGALCRTRPTDPQSGLGRAVRRTNVEGVFEAVRPGSFRGERVLLVDDVLTTGSTASECARALLRAGCAEVEVVTLAVAPLERSWKKVPNP